MRKNRRWKERRRAEARERKRLRKLRRRTQAPRKSRAVYARLINLYVERARVVLPRGRATRREVRFPSRFSLIVNPTESLQVLEKLVGAAARAETEEIFLDQSECVLIDHGAECVATALALDARRRRRVNFMGRFPANEELRETVWATGLPKRLGVETPRPLAAFLSFPLARGRRGRDRPGESTASERLTSGLVEYFDRCLGEFDRALSADAQEALSGIAGEVMVNAEEHGGTREWWVAAYMRRPSKRRYGDCHIAIFNFGIPLAKSLQKLPEDALLRRQIETLADRHRGKGLFGPTWDADDLWTLYALQEGVSRFNPGDVLGDRGQGTVRLIEFFEEFGQSPAVKDGPHMAVLSGNTHIFFDGTYQMDYVDVGGGERRRVIAFNQENDLDLPPDSKYVTRLKHTFPGTVITMRFYLDPKHLRRVARHA